MQNRSRTTYSLMNMIAGLAGYFVNTILGFICRMVFVRCLSEEYLGINGLFSNVLSMLSLAELGIGSAIAFALYKPIAENNEDKIASIMKFYAVAYRIIGSVVAVIGVSMIPLLGYIIGDAPQIKDNLYVIYIVFLFNTCLTYFFSYKATLLTAAQRNYIVLSISYIITIMQSILQIIALLLFREYMIYLGIQTIGTVLFNIIVSRKTVHDYPFIAKKNINPLTKKEKWALFKNIKALTIDKLATVLVNSSDNIIIAYFGGLISVGIASNYILLSGIIDSVTQQLFNGLTASVGNLNAVEDEGNRYRFFNILQFASFVIFGWMSIGIWLCSSDLVNLCFGGKYVLSPEIPFVLGLNFYILKMNTAANTYRSTLGLFKYGQYILIFTAGLNVIISIIFGSIWGLFGIFLATSIARLLTNSWYIPFAIFKHGLKRNPLEYFATFGKYFLLVILEGGLCFLICGLIKMNPVLNVLIKILLCTIIPNVIMWLFFRKSYEFVYLKEKLKQIFIPLRKKLLRH